VRGSHHWEPFFHLITDCLVQLQQKQVLESISYVLTEAVHSDGLQKYIHRMPPCLNKVRSITTASSNLYQNELPLEFHFY
jgi:hypothetical protein